MSEHLRAGREHLARKEHDKAARAFREALLLDPADLDAREGLGLALSRAGDYAHALEELSKVVAADPTRASAQRARSEVLMRLGRFDAAVDDLRRAMELDRGSP